MIPGRQFFVYLRTAGITRIKRLAEYLPFKKLPATRFVILCQPRTGSTLLHTLLNSHPAVFSHGEVIRRTLEEKAKFNLQEVFKKHSFLIEAAGLKWFYSYFSDKRLEDAARAIAADKSIRIIHLVREDIAAAFLSLKRAEQTGTWHVIKEEQGQESDSVNWSRTDFIAFLEQQKQARAFVENTLKQHKIFTISYEQLTANQAVVQEELQDFLELSKKKALFSLLKKQQNRPYHELPGYDQLTDYLNKKRVQ